MAALVGVRRPFQQSPKAASRRTIGPGLHHIRALDASKGHLSELAFGYTFLHIARTNLPPVTARPDHGPGCQRERPPDCCGCAPVDDGYLELEMPEISPVPVPVSVGPSTLHTLSSGVRDGSASVTSTSLTAGRLLRCLALNACERLEC
uniref:Uncharacterized protein n=1 Tax=Anopheles culicifacies TaxID=139723 RepID=A0A182LWQ0_9DIPT